MDWSWFRGIFCIGTMIGGIICLETDISTTSLVGFTFSMYLGVCEIYMNMTFTKVSQMCCATWQCCFWFSGNIRSPIPMMGLYGFIEGSCYTIVFVWLENNNQVSCDQWSIPCSVFGYRVSHGISDSVSPIRNSITFWILCSQQDK